MSDAFVSYAREDETFVSALYDGLVESGKDVWVDWEDIPRSAEWWSEIEAGIEGSDAFVFVISPYSVRSATCRREADHAVEVNKRIVPVFHKKVDGDDVPPSIAAYNWVPFTDELDWDEAFRSLVSALETDLEWVRAHTRWLVRAREWEGHSRDPSLLLRGTELEAAERWLGSAAGKDPEPTALHAEYILAGRKAATRRQRFTTGAVSLALLVSLALAGLAFFQRREAVEQRREAVEQRDNAVSTALATQSAVRLETELDLGALLALEAYRVAPTIEALGAGLTAIRRMARVVAVRRVGRAAVDAIAYDVDGKTLMAADDDGTVMDWTIRNGSPRSSVGWKVRADEVAFAAGANALVAMDPDGRVQTWDTRTRTRVGRQFKLPGQSGTLAASPTGRMIAVSVGFEGVVELWSVESRRRLGKPLRAAGLLSICIAFSPDGSLLASGGDDGVRVWRIGESGARTAATLASPHSIQACAFAPRGDLLAVGREDGRVRLYDTRSFRPVGRALTHGAPVDDVAFSPDGTRLASADENGLTRLWDIRTHRRVLGPLKYGSESIWRLAFSPDGEALAVARNDGTVVVWDVGERSQIAEPLGRARDVHSIAFGRTGKTLVWAREFNNGERSELTFWDVRARRPLGRPLEQRGAVKRLAFGPGDRVLAAAADGGTVLWDLATRTESARLPEPGCAVWGVDFNLGGTAVASGTNCQTVRLWSVADGQPRTVQSHNDVVWDVAFSPGGGVLASAGNDGRVGLFDLRGGRQLREPPRERESISALTFTRAGRLAYAGDLGRVKLWDVAAGRQVGAPLKHDSYVGDVAVSPDGKTLAAAGNGTVTLWDLASFRLLGEPLRYGDPDLPVEVEFAPDGSVMATAAYGSNVLLWDDVVWSRDLQAWKHALCPIVGRNLTLAEWREFLPGEPYRKTCERWPG
jgi:WD40 repeat protein